MTYEFTKQILKFFADNDAHESLEWGCDGETLVFYVRCNDLFMWACSDCEELTEENFPILVKTLEEIKELFPTLSIYHQMSTVIDLFCCRSRKCRPQNPYYKLLAESLVPLFNACGEERQ